MAEDYKPKKIQAGKVQVKGVACPNCHNEMTTLRAGGELLWLCQFLDCRLYDVPYRVVKTLATLERQ